MGYMCSNCFCIVSSIDISEQKLIKGIKNKYSVEEYKCNKCKTCSVVEIDDIVMKAIQILNNKGYITEYCCSGHLDESDTNTYISFKSGKCPNEIPKGFILEDEKYYNMNNWKKTNESLCIRKWYRNSEDLGKQLLQTGIDLIDWAESLNDLQ